MKNDVRHLNCYLEFVSFSMREALEKVRAGFFPELSVAIAYGFADMDALASVGCPKEGSKALVSIHPLFNHRATPEEVIGFVFKHELLHLVVPPREVKGKRRTHPPEFWERERAIAPEGRRVWLWIWVNFGPYLRRHPRLEVTRVKRGARKILDEPRLSIEECEALYPTTPAQVGGLEGEEDGAL